MNSENLPTNAAPRSIPADRAANIDPIDRAASAQINSGEIASQEVIQLLEERLVVDRSKRKVGEVVVRKEITTRMVQVPIRSERLIIEQVGDEVRQLASVDLGEGEVTGVELVNAIEENGLRPSSAVRGTFTSLARAVQVLNELNNHLQGQFDQIQIEILLKDEKLQAAYQSWMDRNSI